MNPNQELQDEGILFTSQQHGYLWDAADQGRSLAATSDGGIHWKVLASPGDVQDVMADGSSVWAVSGTPDRGKTEPVRLWESPDGGETWNQSTSPPPASTGVLAATRVDQTIAYLVTSPQNSSSPRLALSETSDSGQSWVTRPALPAGCTYEGVFLQADTPSDLWLACGGGSSAGEESKAIYRSSDSGQTWQTAAFDEPPDPSIGELTIFGYINQLEAVSANVAYIAEERGPLLETTDGGKTWKAVASNYDTGALDVVIAPPLSPTSDVALVDGQSWTTSNGVIWAPTT